MVLRYGKQGKYGGMVLDCPRPAEAERALARHRRKAERAAHMRRQAEIRTLVCRVMGNRRAQDVAKECGLTKEVVRRFMSNMVLRSRIEHLDALERWANSCTR